VAPSSFNYLGSAGFGAPGQTGINGADLVCYTNLPLTAGSGKKPPTFNTTGILKQSATTGPYEETLLGVIPIMDANSGNLPNGAAGSVPMAFKAFPMPLTVTACYVTWTPFAGCSPFPTFAIVDTTSSTTLCSSGTVTTSSSASLVVPTTTAIGANDAIVFEATSVGTSCTAGLASISMVGKE
jgi:hypothetical protein